MDRVKKDAATPVGTRAREVADIQTMRPAICRLQNFANDRLAKNHLATSRMETLQNRTYYHLATDFLVIFGAMALGGTGAALILSNPIVAYVLFGGAALTLFGGGASDILGRLHTHHQKKKALEDQKIEYGELSEDLIAVTEALKRARKQDSYRPRKGIEGKLKKLQRRATRILGRSDPYKGTPGWEDHIQPFLKQVEVALAKPKDKTD